MRTRLKYFLNGLSLLLAVIGGLFFFIGGLVIHALGKVDRFLAELMGIAVAFVCLIGCGIAKHMIDDIEWKEANEEATVPAGKAEG